MNNPYRVLGVNENDSDETIKQAYRELARKYHPDNYTDNPLSDLAQEKMKEINQAYDEIMAMRKGGSREDPGASAQYTGANAELFMQIRQFVNAGNIETAEQMLGSFSISDRNAEWYFLMGSVFYKKGWYDEARSNFNTACNLDPSNAEYRRAANQMNTANHQYRQYRTGGGLGGGGCCDCCTSLICADCLCECLGGNLCPCIGCR